MALNGVTTLGGSRYYYIEKWLFEFFICGLKNSTTIF